MIFEVADYVAFVLAGLGGLGIGRRMTRPDPPLRPICTCDHGFGHHENGKRCMAVKQQYYNAATHLDPCRCQRYDGPNPAIFGLEDVA